MDENDENDQQAQLVLCQLDSVYPYKVGRRLELDVHSLYRMHTIASF